jgi:hypothetical protein
VLGTEPRERGDGGAPAGWAGWRRRVGAARDAGVGLVACSLADFFALGAAVLAFGAAALAVAVGAAVLAFGAAAVASVLAGRAARLSLRRCGRRCGSADKTSEEGEFRSVIARFRRC